MVEERLAKSFLMLGNYLEKEIDRLENEYTELLLMISSEKINSISEILITQFNEKRIELDVLKRINSIIYADKQTLLNLMDSEEKIKMEEV